MADLKRRLNRLEVRRNDGFTDVRTWIRAGRYYDELTDAERERYCLYCNSDRIGLEQVEGYFNGLHFLLERNPPPPTAAEHAATIRELEEWFEQAKRDFMQKEMEREINE